MNQENSERVRTDFEKASTLSRYWKWFTGGGVVGLALVLGCASAIDFRDSGREAGTKHDAKHDAKPFSRGVAAEPGDEPMHNNGKIRMPITVTVEGAMEVVIRRDTNMIFTITAESDVTRLQGHVQGMNGQESFAGFQIDVPELKAGETHLIELSVPAKSGSLVFRLVGDFLVGDVETRTMSGGYEIKIVNPDQVKAATKASGPADLGNATQVDSSGQLVQPMKSSQPSTPAP